MNTGFNPAPLWRGGVYYTTLDSPLGVIYIAFTEKGVSRIDLGTSEKEFVKDLKKVYHRIKRNGKGISLLRKEFRDYFSGQGSCYRSFSYPIDILDGTPFERKVWLGIKEIPYGKVVSYKELAIKIGRPKAARAIGMACKRNPLPIIIPCHRVIGKDGRLRGYSSGVNRLVHTRGIEIKKRLLDMEGVRNITT